MPSSCPLHYDPCGRWSVPKLTPRQIVRQEVNAALQELAELPDPTGHLASVRSRLEKALSAAGRL